MLKSININQIDENILNPRLIQAKQLDVNTILSGYDINTNNDITQINEIIKNNISRDYKIIKYIGKGINGNIYLVKDINNKTYICKKISLNNNKNQIEFELKILDYLSKNNNSRPYINPCKDYKIIDKYIITIFPVFDGYSLSNMQNYMIRLNPIEYYKITFYLIKNILKGLSIIHNMNIAHQNITNNSILISTKSKDSKYNLPIKFTDFGLGCGTKKKITDNYKNDIFFNTCSNMNYPIKIDNKVINQLNESDFIKIAQKWDILCLGVIFLKLLLPDITRDLKVTNEYNITLKQFCNTLRDLDKNKLNIRNINNDVKNDILNYLDIILKFMTTDIKKREKCNYILDKIIIYEKYKFDLI